ncbi:hypothetical protein DS2_14649 [Catenovulum agarivorans DS-2]|uniref:DUF6933 domain-containing protein n=1 Tax=Catenovulum agarivorans DS-2 TaxID=1328313 RepID=W7QJA1_9ALTE|nr:hypothetical protein [Catenovulum agarivorans]EWH09022.1 hypothetical protein DS2_14649 [Catenovulum agarivorans DS-2]
MIELFCTQKLIAKLPVSQGLLPEGIALNESLTEKILNNPLSGWHANLLTIQRRNCILMVHNQTRFPLLLIGLTKKDFAVLDYHFADALMNTLLKLGADEEQMQAAQDLLAPVSIAKAFDRSVQGTMNQMKGDLEHFIWFDDLNIMDCSAYKLSVWLAKRPCTVKGQKDCVWPDKAMLQLLTSNASLFQN